MATDRPQRDIPPEEDEAVANEEQARRRLTPLFRSVFQDIPTEEHLLGVYKCAYQLDTLVQGKLYLTEKHICFHSNLVGFETVLTLEFVNIVAIEKQRTALVIPNAIWVLTANHEYTFTSFLSRENAYVRMRQLWRETAPTPQSRPPVAGDEALAAPAPSSQPETSVLTIGTPVHQASKQPMVRSINVKNPKEQQEHPDWLPLERPILTKHYTCTADDLYALLFAKDDFIGKFWEDDCGYTDVELGRWGDGDTRERLVCYTKPLKAAMGPSRAEIHESQSVVLMIKGEKYIVDLRCRALNVPYGDAFETLVRYIIAKDADESQHCMLSVTADIAWARSVMAMVRSMIVRSTYEGVETQIGALDQAISAHLGETPKPPADAVRDQPTRQGIVVVSMVVAAGSMALNVILLVAIYLLHQRVQTLEQLLAETRCTASYWGL